MTSPNKLNEFNHAEDLASQLLEQLGWTYAPAEALASKARMRRRGWQPRRPGSPHRSRERTTVTRLRPSSQRWASPQVRKAAR